MTPRLTRWGVLIPLLGLVLIVLQSELRRRSGTEWPLKIVGYDPRDLIHGHYLRYRFHFDAASSETACLQGQRLAAACCLCLEPTSDPRAPEVRPVPCEAARECSAWILSSEVQPPLRYLIPEADAPALERALRLHDAVLRIRALSDGTISVGDLELDGRPWSEVVREAAEPRDE
ncbi:MAG: GDYXXLXY domain-containing protein [Myxococcota bacterium]